MSISFRRMRHSRTPRCGVGWRFLRCRGGEYQDRDALLVIWSLFKGLNDFGLLVVDLKVRGLLLLLFFEVAVLEGLGLINFKLPARRVE